MTTIPQLSQILQNLLIEDADRIGRESGFIKRQRKLSGASFAQSLIFGWQANPQASLEELCQSASVCGVEISPQGLQERLNSPQANRFLHQLLLQGVSYLVQSQNERDDLLPLFCGCLHSRQQPNRATILPTHYLARYEKRASHTETTGGARLSAWTV